MTRDLRLALSPHSISLVRVAPFWRRKAAAVAWLRVDAPAGQRPSWRAAIAGLPALFAKAGIRGGRASVVLSNHFVRYLVVPAGEDLATQSEEESYVRGRLAQIHGEAALEWALRIGDGPADGSHLAAAIDAELIEALRSELKLLKVALASCRPALPAVVDAARARIGDDAWVVLAERGRLLVASIRAGQWQMVRSRPTGPETIVLREVLAQESMLSPGTSRECKVFLSATAEAEVDAEGVTVHPLQAGERGTVVPDGRARIALAPVARP